MNMTTAADVKPFVERVGRELQRAERYRIFVSLIVLDLNSIEADSGGGEIADLAKLVDLVTGNTRSVDYTALVETGKVAVLLPETPRQGAEVAGRRVAEIIRSSFQSVSSDSGDHVIPLEMASFPDAAGARTVQQMLSDIAPLETNN
ncbi:MAG: hypothetical protein OEV49_11105 [candidate division Zixibacteria bacterium]|nr:hypothetical protein [candidate division Zixibacteria bacterium]MDH3936725.1 hypothetical protein [candidate division Zixibacteria bacterium]MDH4033763.1 hypothetical protein [candidate division Zixibacteria bacterium]